MMHSSTTLLPWLVLVSCTPGKNQSVPLQPDTGPAPLESAAAVAASATPAPSASWPPPTPPLSAQKGACPMTLRPGLSFGPISIGQRTETLAASGLPVKKVSEYGPVAFFEVGPYHARSCGGAVDDIWIDDLRTAPACLAAPGEVPRSIARQPFLKLFRNCHDLPPRIGGAFVECEGGGVRVGYGTGNFLQIRVSRVGSDLDATCEDLLDDGHAEPLDGATLHALLERTLGLDLLSPYWHVDQPHRDPLRIVPHDLLGGAPPKMKMFGSPVQWIGRETAQKDGLPYFELTSIRATARRVTIEFRYPVEGIHGAVEFARRGDRWELEKKSVVEP